MRLVSPAPGSLAAARTYLVNAQGFAAAVSNDPGVDAFSNLTAGVTAAKRAASELFMAEPRSPFQDLVQARRDVIEGQQALQNAITLLTSVGNGVSDVDPTPQVKLLADQAFNAFESAFEIIDND